MVSPDVLSHGSFADGRRSREHDQRRPVIAWVRLGQAVIEKRTQSLLLPTAEAAESLHGRDLQVLEDSVSLADADRGDRGEELCDPHRTGR